MIRKLMLSVITVMSLIVLFSYGINQTYAVEENETIENINWSYKDGVLTISGTGAIADRQTNVEYPWYSGKSKIVKVVIEEGITVIGSNAFSGYNKLVEVVLPESLTEIHDYAFYNCTSLKQCVLPERIESLGWYVFSNCYELKVMELPETLKSLGNYVFSGCDGLTEMIMPESLEYIGFGAFNRCRNLVDVQFPSKIKETGHSVLADCTSIKEIVLPVGLTTINSNAFEGCTSLTKITLPSTLKTIDKYAFKDCTKLQNLTIPNTVTHIGDGAFSRCYGFTELKLPDYLTYLGKFAFFHCENITHMTIPETITIIDDYTFFYCTSLKDIQFNDNITHIGYQSFYNNNKLAEIKFPASLVSIGDQAFEECKSLTQLVFPEKLERLGSSAFAFCSNLKEVTIPESVKDMQLSSFAWCMNIDTANVDIKALPMIEYLMESDLKTLNIFNGTNTDKIVLNYDLTNSLQWYKTSLEKVIFNSDVLIKDIDAKAFRHMKKLTHVVLPDSVMNIANGAFYDLPVLNTVTLDNKKVSVIPQSFVKCPKFTNMTTSKGENITYGQSLPFSDVNKNDWYYGAVSDAYELGLMTGATDTLFKPNANMNRGMVAIVFHRMEGSPKVSYNSVFKDVANNQYYTTSVLWAKQKGVINGYNDGTFKPTKNVTREEMATMIYNFAKYKGINVKASKDISGYSDYAKITPYARVTLQWAIENGIMSGKDNGTRLDPLGNATRAECSKMLVQAYKIIYK